MYTIIYNIISKDLVKKAFLILDFITIVVSFESEYIIHNWKHDLIYDNHSHMYIILIFGAINLVIIYAI